MKKQSVLSALLIVVSLILVFSAMTGCAKPKPEPKLTPTATAVKPAMTTTTSATTVPTTAPSEPTVVTTRPSPVPTQPGTTAVVSGAASPTPVVIAPAPGAATPASAQPAQPQPTGEFILHKVNLGDTLFSLAARYGTSVEAISALNGISRPDQIYAGMTLKIPKTAGGTTPTGVSVEYKVQAGDNLGSIANKFGVTMDAIMRANGLTNPDFVFVGQKLVIPGGSGGTPATGTSRVHVVKPGETLDMIASLYGTTRGAIVAANRLANPNWIYVGQSLKIP